MLNYGLTFFNLSILNETKRMKFPVLLILFLLPLSFINAQGYEELNKKVQNSFGQGQYGLALVFAEQAAE
ncbi:MAG: hypothetical protein B6D45_06845, partial [Ignavibacteriales bacterium UTCHB3]